MMKQSGKTAWQIATKVPKITIYFWVVKLLTTAMGESTSDYLVGTINPYIAVVLGSGLLVAALVWQLRSKRYVAYIYWAAALAVSIAGTMGADVLHVEFGVPYGISTATYLVILLGIFWWWHRSEGTLSIHSVSRGGRELYYWAAILATFALGTAAGDWTAFTLHAGFLLSGVIFAVLFLLPGIYFWVTRSHAILTFWIAYILTRPLGASFADWLGKPESVGGIGLGDGTVAIVLGILIVAAVAYLTLTRRDAQSHRGGGKL